MPRAAFAFSFIQTASTPSIVDLVIFRVADWVVLSDPAAYSAEVK
ncbi:hypothetical protein LNA02_21390 [Levilactobacillus namurensis]|nr:hypothetical protein LNA02_21390 [Levilactobacillus namurensis]